MDGCQLRVVHFIYLAFDAQEDEGIALETLVQWKDRGRWKRKRMENSAALKCGKAAAQKILGSVEVCHNRKSIMNYTMWCRQHFPSFIIMSKHSLHDDDAYEIALGLIYPQAQVFCSYAWPVLWNVLVGFNGGWRLVELHINKSPSFFHSYASLISYNKWKRTPIKATASVPLPFHCKAAAMMSFIIKGRSLFALHWQL